MLNRTREQKQARRRADIQRALLHYEARLGGELFGPVPKGVRREFFCLDPHTWVWHEEWNDAQGRHRVMTTRYDVRPTGIVKSQGDSVYQSLSDEELRNFYAAIQLYSRKVGTELQRIAQGA
ncbi:MAG TPA: hypothetical protein VHC98_01315 [Candidatus Saccharimonadales bacterium]|nr:hypothetical protein [Candidatus Saccharimonadales bacterium]